MLRITKNLTLCCKHMLRPLYALVSLFPSCSLSALNVARTTEYWFLFPHTFPSCQHRHPSCEDLSHEYSGDHVVPHRHGAQRDLRRVMPYVIP